jgi:hypothetical protein
MPPKASLPPGSLDSPSIHPAKTHTAQKAESQQVSRRKATVFGKSEELSRLSDSNVLTVIRKRKTNQIYIYSSTDVDPLIRELVRRFAKVVAPQRLEEHLYHRACA